MTANMIPLEHRLRCAAIDEDEGEEVVWFHRHVFTPNGSHVSGPRCFCEPVPHTRAEMERAGFWDQLNASLISCQ